MTECDICAGSHVPGNGPIPKPECGLPSTIVRLVLRCTRCRTVDGRTQAKAKAAA